MQREADMRNTFISDMRDIEFHLWDVHGLECIVGNDERIWDQVALRQVLRTAEKFAVQVLGPLWQHGDQQGSTKTVTGEVALPDGFQEAWTKYVQCGWQGLAIPISDGGLGLPYAIVICVQEILYGANPAFMALSDFCESMFFMLKRHASKELQEWFCSPLAEARWSACLCLTEPDAGSDLRNISTKAVLNKDGSYNIVGVKTFISAGSHELTENILYAVLARIEGTKGSDTGLSCFIVPRYRQNGGGQWLQHNDVECARLENKMGWNALPTAELVFGGCQDCVGYIVGAGPSYGLIPLSVMMSHARVGTGVYALGLASTAYLNSVKYANTRRQGDREMRSFSPVAERVRIAEHPDVKRMLLEMQFRVEGCRSLVIKFAIHCTTGSHPWTRRGGRSHSDRMSALLVPIIKAFISDQAWRVAELAIQVHGAYGYTRDLPVEQCAREIKLLSIWEGTNHLQAVDLLRSRFGFGKNTAMLKAFQHEINLSSIIGMKCGFSELSRIVTGVLNEFEKLMNAISYAVDVGRMPAVLSIANAFLDYTGYLVTGAYMLEAAACAHKRLVDAQVNDSEEHFLRSKIRTTECFFSTFLHHRATATARSICLSLDNDHDMCQ